MVFYDQLGCGKSDRPDDKGLWTTERFLRELQQVRDALELGEVHILGHSSLEIFEKSSHMTMLEEPERYTEVVRNFLRGVDY